jgi:tetratricopeptide (TPR) repeat protein
MVDPERATEPRDDAITLYQVIAAHYSACWVETNDDRYSAKALELLDSGVARHPDAAELLLARGIHRWMSGDVRGSAIDFEAAIRQTADSSAERDERTAGMARSFLQSDWEQAVMNAAVMGDCDRGLEIVASTAPLREQGTAWFEVAYAAHALCAQKLDRDDLLDEGFRILDAGLEEWPTSVRLPAIKGYGLEARGNHDDALELLRKARSRAESIPAYESERFSSVEQVEAFRAGLNERIEKLESRGK